MDDNPIACKIINRLIAIRFERLTGYSYQNIQIGVYIFLKIYCRLCHSKHDANIFLRS